MQQTAEERSSHCFRPVYRLRKTDEFSSVFAFRKVLRGRYFSLHYRPNGDGSARLGVVVAKKLARRAVERNLIKRMIRELFRLRRGNLPAMDCIVRLSAPARDATRRQLREDARTLMERLT